jgi:hypothetical protein
MAARAAAFYLASHDFTLPCLFAVITEGVDPRETDDRAMRRDTATRYPWTKPRRIRSASTCSQPANALAHVFAIAATANERSTLTSPAR